MYNDTDREERSSMIEMTEAENDSLGEMTEAEYGVLGEAAEAEYGICDFLDENIPSPLEMDNAGEKLVLPEIQDMTEYHLTPEKTCGFETIAQKVEAEVPEPAAAMGGSLCAALPRGRAPSSFPRGYDIPGTGGKRSGCAALGERNR